MDTLLSTPLKTAFYNTNPKALSSRNIRLRFPEEYALILEKYSWLDASFSEKLYLYVNNMDEPPCCMHDGCKNYAAFRNALHGFRQYCSIKCSNSDPIPKSKTKQTCLEKYGVANIMSSQIFKEKAKQTNLKKYGAENVFASEEIKKRIKKHYNEKYGVDYPSQSQEIQETRKKNSIKKYGVDHHMKVDDIKNKITNTNRQYAIDTVNGLIGFADNGQRIMQCPHPECNKCTEKTYLITSDQRAARKAFNIEPCTHILPIKQSHSSGTTFELFVRDMLDGANIKYITNTRTILDNKYELDIYIPDKNLAIECNGLPWHAEINGKYSTYHLNKFLKCQNKGIQLLMFWYDQYIHHPEIIKSIILSKLGIYNERIYARKCMIKEIDSHSSTEFLEDNHIQGRTNANIRLGLYYNNILYGVMTFSKRSKLSGGKNHSNEWELNRFCTKIDVQVIGGAGRLLKYFIKQYKPNTIISFASNDISNGNLYKKLGFKTDNKITTSYWYISHKEYIRYHRTNFTKTRLKAMGYDTTNNTEAKIMSELPYFKIHDSGHVKYILNVE